MQESVLILIEGFAANFARMDSQESTQISDPVKILSTKAATIQADSHKRKW